MPRTIHPRPQAPGNHPTRVLFVTNYLQRDARIGDEFPRRAYLEELLLSIPELRRIYGDRFHFRWRPHPVDNEDAVREVLANYESVELSRGCPLSQDALWADLVISTVSSAAVELLLTGVPVFLHVMPTETNTPDVRFFAPERRFHRAGEFVNEFTRCVTLMDAGDPQATRPDREACTAFFGPAGEPGNILEWLERELSATTPG
jgi:hypothetical protein